MTGFSVHSSLSLIVCRDFRECDAMRLHHAGIVSPSPMQSFSLLENAVGDFASIAVLLSFRRRLSYIPSADRRLSRQSSALDEDRGNYYTCMRVRDVETDVPDTRLRDVFL